MKRNESKISKSITQGLVIMLSMQIAASPALAGVDQVLNSNSNQISAGSTAYKPSVKDVCATLKNAKDGIFKNEKGEELQTIDPACASQYTFRSEQNKYCMKPLSAVVAKEKESNGNANIDTVCAGGALKGALATYCALRTMANTNGTYQYCDAYESADKASTKLALLAAMNAAGAGVCWAEYLTLQALMKNPSVPPATLESKAKAPGPCSNASIAAGTAEIINAALMIG